MKTLLKLSPFKKVYDGDDLYVVSTVALCNTCHNNFNMYLLTKNNNTSYEYKYCPHCGLELEGSNYENNYDERVL